MYTICWQHANVITDIKLVELTRYDLFLLLKNLRILLFQIIFDYMNSALQTWKKRFIIATAFYETE